MITWFDRLSLRAKLVAGFAALIALSLVVGAAALFSHNRGQAATDAYFDRYDRIAHLSLQGQAAMLRARRHEKDFLLRRTESGFDAAQSRHGALVGSELATLRSLMEEIRRLADGPQLAEQVGAIAVTARRYEEGFRHVVELYGRLGRVDSGLEGRLRQRAHDLERLLGPAAPSLLTADLLALRRAEKDFIMRGQGENATAFAIADQKLRRDVAASALPAARRAELVRLAAEYRDLFDGYVALKTDIDAATLAYLREVHAAEPALDRVFREASERVAAIRGTLRQLSTIAAGAVVGASLLAIVLGLGVAVFIGRSIGRSLRPSVDFAGRLAAGDLSARLPTTGGKELAALAEAFNRMADSLQEARRLEEERGAELARLNRTLRVLSQCNYALVRAADEHELLEGICRQVVETGGYRLAWVGLAVQDADKTIGPAAVAGADDGYVASLHLSWGDDERRRGLGGRAICGRQPVWVRDVQSDPIFEPWRDLAIRHGVMSCIALPLIARGEVLGCLSIYSGTADGFEAAEVDLLRELADDLAFGMASLREAAARERAERALDYQANYDELTGLPNRNLLRDRLRQAAVHAARGDVMVAVLLLGLDRFKALNESLGHEAGDALLKHVAQALTACLREGDTVARLAGDEFAVVLGDAQRAEDVVPVARKLLAAVGAPLAYQGREVVTGASIGISLYPKDGTDTDGLIYNAEAAMHGAKSLGGDTFQFYAPEMNQRVTARFALEAGLRRAIERSELLVHYQPKVGLASGRLVGAEALVRWRHPEMGLVSPGDFIPLAEETGLITPMGEWVLDHVCEQLRTWLTAGLPVPAVAVNLSTRQFRQANLPQVVEQALRLHELPADYLDLEITESSLMDNLEAAVATLRELKRIGVRLSLDDFGTGYSSLSYLKRFPIDYLKIDRAFVRDITTDPDDAAICLAVISLAHNLKLKVIAEGVETEGQMNYLRQHGCDEIQGYYFSRPLPAEDFGRLLAERKTWALPAADQAERTLLLVDDEANILTALKRALHREGYRILSAGSAAEGFDLLSTHDVQVILCDQRMPEMNGTEFLARVRDLYPDTVRIVLSGYAELDAVTDAVNRGAIYKFLTKPWDRELLCEHLREAFRHQEAMRRRGG